MYIISTADVLKIWLGRTEVEHSPYYPEVEGLSLAEAEGTGREKSSHSKLAWLVLKNSKLFCKVVARAQCYKTFYGRNLRIFVIRYVCPWQAFQV